MERMNIFVNTSELVKTLNEIGKRSHSSDWKDEDGKTLYDLQEELKKERDFLQSFWITEKGESGREYTSIPLGGLAGWNWEQALYDMPLYLQKYALERSDGKYGIFHERERWLEELQHDIFCLFHAWHFDTQGWTAY